MLVDKRQNKAVWSGSRLSIHISKSRNISAQFIELWHVNYRWNGPKVNDSTAEKACVFEYTTIVLTRHKQIIDQQRTLMNVNELLPSTRSERGNLRSYTTRHWMLSIWRKLDCCANTLAHKPSNGTQNLGSGTVRVTRHLMRCVRGLTYLLPTSLCCYISNLRHAHLTTGMTFA